MAGLLYLGLGAGIAAFGLAVASASAWRRYAGLVVLGVALALVWFAAILLTASTDPNHPGCADCEYIWGRWWWPPLVAGVLGLNLAGWTIGATLGWVIRRRRG